MGARKKEAPRRGSAGLRPRKRAESLVPRVRSWPQVDVVKPLAFLGYKVGMTHAIIVDDREHVDTAGQEIFMPVTVIETPPMVALGLRVYGYDPNVGHYTLGEFWKDPSDSLRNAFGEDVLRKYLLGFSKRLPHMVEPLGSGKGFKLNLKEKEIDVDLDKVKKVSLIMSTIPFLAGGVEKKAIDILEVKIGGQVQEAFEYAKGKLGGLIDVEEVIEAGKFVDVIGVTKGKGFQGVIKRFGVKELPKWHKHRKGSRRVGARSSGRGTSSYVPQPGQMGFHRRTDYNKRVIMISDDPSKINVAGGWLHYGLVKSKYVVLAGSVFGPPKRPIILRLPVRPPSWEPAGAPPIRYISLSSKQGN
ncbi:50S ribosomal protein L3 [Ignicoccus islandicus DSM 13165]|uniref:Large ribosomal subunit protein uL3 n=1 Tax=Ignicoccus islandicus DSM 13165 TaxID=940295 RepID=A0A0U3E880_9CREN|nr:50S ribosomal protein L3 [Ignicoccus islandicus]ALU11566.1 50S ribosomal protein L3 [Ignicoccus islandicus DSM 13165]